MKHEAAKMPSNLDFKNPSVPQALLIYFSALFFWHFICSFIKVENIDFVKYGAASASIYWIAKLAAAPRFFGRPLHVADAAEMILLSVTTVLTGIGCWSLLVFLDALLIGDGAAERWGLISHQAFATLQWSPPWLIGYLLASAFFAPITEEIIFRGFILNRLLERHGRAVSVIASAGVFAALHFDKSFLGAFVHGMIFAGLVLRTSSLYAAILVHGLYNATVFALRVLFGFSLVADPKALAILGYWIPEFLCGLAGLVLLAAYFSLVAKRSVNREQAKRRRRSGSTGPPS